MQNLLGYTTGDTLGHSLRNYPYKYRVITKWFEISGIYLFSKQRSLWCLVYEIGILLVGNLF